MIISGRALWNTLSLRSFHYKIVVPQSLLSWKWANWSSRVKSSVGEAGSCHWWVFLLSKATRATCRAELVPWWGMSCHSLYKHRVWAAQGWAPRLELQEVMEPFELSTSWAIGRKLALRRAEKHKHLRWDWINRKLISASSEGCASIMSALLRKSVESQQRNLMGKTWCYLMSVTY